ncbi:MAG: hypothetical protein NTZ32_06420 [Planctomycetales bacterium]|nr:hypothetical protein [Planctomycetales bacterium]
MVRLEDSTHPTELAAVLSRQWGERSPTPTANVYEVFYAHQTLGRFDVSQTPRGSPEVLNIHRVLRE